MRWMKKTVKTLTSYHFSVATNLKCNGDASIYMEKYDVFMWLWTLWMRWTIVLMLKSRKMEYWLYDWPWTRIRLNRNRCCERNEIDIWIFNSIYCFYGDAVYIHMRLWVSFLNVNELKNKRKDNSPNRASRGGAAAIFLFIWGWSWICDKRNENYFSHFNAYYTV